MTTAEQAWEVVMCANRTTAILARIGRREENLGWCAYFLIPSGDRLNALGCVQRSVGSRERVNRNKKIGSGAWTRTMIARSKVWSPTN